MIITLLRKPLEGTVADNTLKYGCGAINIDATRVGTEARQYKGSGKSNQVYTESRAGMSDGRGKDMVFKVEGRWPANFILTHKEGCELKGTKKIKSSSGRGAVKKESSAEKLGNQGSAYSKESRKEGTIMICHVDEEGKEEGKRKIPKIMKWGKPVK